MLNGNSFRLDFGVKATFEQHLKNVCKCHIRLLREALANYGLKSTLIILVDYLQKRALNILIDFCVFRAIISKFIKHLIWKFPKFTALAFYKAVKHEVLLLGFRPARVGQRCQRMKTVVSDKFDEAKGHS